jgi:hypothetical protein
MGTRSMIGKLEADGTVTAIYCHWDGYAEGVGLMLMKHYRDVAKVDALMALGDLSSLGAEIGERHPFSRHDAFMSDAISEETYDDLYGNMCLSYARDRNEEDVAAKIFANIDVYAEEALPMMGAEFLYLYEDGFWHCWDRKGMHINLYDMNVEV